MTMTRAEQAALNAYPKEPSKIYQSYFGLLEFNKNAPERKAFQEGYEQAEKYIIQILESRLSEIIGDAQPKPVLRAEIRSLIDKIQEK